MHNAMTLFDDVDACREAREGWIASEESREQDEQDPIQRAFSAGFFDGMEYGFDKAVRTAVARMSPKDVSSVFDIPLIEAVKMKARISNGNL